MGIGDYLLISGYIWLLTAVGVKTEAIMKKCGIVIDEHIFDEDDDDSLSDDPTTPEKIEAEKFLSNLHSLSRQEIEKGIAKAVAKEDYEFAKIYKDELLRRESNEQKE